MALSETEGRSCSNWGWGWGGEQRVAAKKSHSVFNEPFAVLALNLLIELEALQDVECEQQQQQAQKQQGKQEWEQSRRCDRVTKLRAAVAH